MKATSRFAFLTVALLFVPSSPGDIFRVATYNVENYLDQPTATHRGTKSAASRAKVRESIRALHPDVLALEEMGTTNALQELCASLQAEGESFPFREWVEGADTNIHIAVLSRLPIVARRPHTRETFLLDGKRLRVERGFAEVDIRAAPDFTFTLIAAHLKSRRPVPSTDEALERLEEAKILRRLVDEHFHAAPNAKLIVLGDFNDVKNSEPVRTLIGHGKFRLTDTRPAERRDDGATEPMSSGPLRAVTWTHYYGQEDTYSRIDYILISPALTRFWRTNGTYVLALPGWGTASDHRPLVAEFQTESP
jgi:endonuclease/exonuclease/phosphatase family metal-dependent hydrolase